jgi:lysophospholipase L1-like esterase
MPEKQMKPSPHSSWGGKVFLVLINIAVVVGFFGGIEIAMRRHYSQKGRGLSAIQPRDLRDRFTGWRNNPSFWSPVVQYNRQGFRHSTPVSRQKPANTVRIFLLGGSAAYGLEGAYGYIDDKFKTISNDQLIDHFLAERLNREFPSVRWEVVNAAVMEYRLYQDLFQIETTILGYHPDYVIMMDGYNDMAQLIGATPAFDYFSETPHFEEFNSLANPSGLSSLLTFSTVWLRDNSAFYFFIDTHLRFQASQARQVKIDHGQLFERPVDIARLSAVDQQQFRLSQAHVGYYARTARQINRILELDGVKRLFLLQPVLILSHKRLTDAERRLADHVLKSGGALDVAEFEQFYPQFSESMKTAAAADAFPFEDLTGLFDPVPWQAFTDYCHLTPDANRRIAERIFELMRSSLAESASRSRP